MVLFHQRPKKSNTVKQRTGYAQRESHPLMYHRQMPPTDLRVSLLLWWNSVVPCYVFYCCSQVNCIHNHWLISSCLFSMKYDKLIPPSIIDALGDMPQIAKFMRPTWGPPGLYRPQMGPMLAPWTLLSGAVSLYDKIGWDKLSLVSHYLQNVNISHMVY